MLFNKCLRLSMEELAGDEAAKELTKDPFMFASFLCFLTLRNAVDNWSVTFT